MRVMNKKKVKGIRGSYRKEVKLCHMSCLLNCCFGPILLMKITAILRGRPRLLYLISQFNTPVLGVNPSFQIYMCLAIKWAPSFCFSFPFCQSNQAEGENPTSLWGIISKLLTWITKMFLLFFFKALKTLNRWHLTAAKSAWQPTTAHALTCTMKACFNVNQMPTQVLVLS